MRPFPLMLVPVLLLMSLVRAPVIQAGDADRIVRDSFNAMRGETSHSTVTMTIHRPAWERSMTIRGWTRGETESLMRILDPPRDRGNGTLKIGRNMWTYNPKVNRVIQLPPSMMSQAWMGSDFTNEDLARSDTLILDYEHHLDGGREENGHQIHRIRSVPLPDAPVVWGLLRLEIRDDGVLLSETFLDEEGRPVKALVCTDIQSSGGRLFPRTMTMRRVDTPEEWTRIEYRELAFDVPLPENLFTRSSLMAPDIPAPPPS